MSFRIIPAQSNVIQRQVLGTSITCQPGKRAPDYKAPKWRKECKTRRRRRIHDARTEALYFSLISFENVDDGRIVVIIGAGYLLDGTYQ